MCSLRPFPWVLLFSASTGHNSIQHSAKRLKLTTYATFPTRLKFLECKEHVSFVYPCQLAQNMAHMALVKWMNETFIENLLCTRKYAAHFTRAFSLHSLNNPASFLPHHQLLLLLFFITQQILPSPLNRWETKQKRSISKMSHSSTSTWKEAQHH